MARSPASRASAWLRAPLFHFLVIGGIAFALQPTTAPTLVIGPVERERLRTAFEARERRPPNGPELEALLEGWIEEEILLREAWASGGLEHDGTVVQRLVLLGRFVEGSEEPGPEEAVARARALGLDRSDPVIRRYLIERMRLAIGSEADTPEPGKAELAAHLAANRHRFRSPERLRLDHVFVSARYARLEARAASFGEALAGNPPEAVPSLGDPFPRGRRETATRAELARDFGPAFLDDLDPALHGRWQGPARSAHGLHWVWFSAPPPAREPALDEVRGQVRQDLLQERRAAHLRRRLATLRAGYEIQHEPPRAGDADLGSER